MLILNSKVNYWPIFPKLTKVVTDYFKSIDLSIILCTAMTDHQCVCVYVFVFVREELFFFFFFED